MHGSKKNVETNKCLLLDDVKRHHRTFVDVGGVVASCHHNSTRNSWHVLGAVPGMI